MYEQIKYIIKSNFIEVFTNKRIITWILLLNAVTVLERVLFFSDKSLNGIILVSIICWIIGLIVCFGLSIMCSVSNILKYLSDKK